MKISELPELLRTSDYRTFGDEARFAQCPVCKYDSEDNAPFSVNLDTGKYFCHYCHKGGDIRSLFSENQNDSYKKIEHSYKPIKDLATGLSTQEADFMPYLDGKYDIAEDSLSAKYLLSRGIKPSMWQDLDSKLKEKKHQHDYALVYLFVNEAGLVIAIQRTFIDKDAYKIERNYKGKKSDGVAILKDLPQVIVSEGLETGLSVKQHLKESFNEDYGLIIAGDAGGLASLADRNAWALEGRTKIIIAGDNDESEVGQKAARKVYERFHPKSLLYIPMQTGKDWNDLLKENKIKEGWL